MIPSSSKDVSSATYVGKYGSSLVVAGREKAEMRRVAILYSPLTGEAFCLSAEDTGGVKWEDACTEGWLANDAERIASARKTFWELVEK